MKKKVNSSKGGKEVKGPPSLSKEGNPAKPVDSRGVDPIK